MPFADKAIHPRIAYENAGAAPVDIHGNPFAAGISVTHSSNDIGTTKLLRSATVNLGTLRRL
ncbi:MAG: hypothetical protein KGK16_09985 [Bradyrhizobium sp.]|uniref:hypothetical protein n=1 Tax=Bradyrhizobium sp. TaxID=376 RepID=UPI001ECC8FC6|nr:hypothetical protein [Bradyrhizobium sp.]MBU6459196.1 hypothetical protein [Bradyrhizobium sp.]MDE2331096.1 hypothetical protein [Bradyrhizobium sp.]MDE2603377.1 hypothetical protein [Bradyrhizobium sp.]